SAGSHFDNRSAPKAVTLAGVAAEEGCPVKVPAAELHHFIARLTAVRAIKVVQPRLINFSGEFEDCAVAERSAAPGLAIKIDIIHVRSQAYGAFVCPVSASCFRAKSV